MTTAMTCGFLHHVIAPEVMNFERLHIFLLISVVAVHCSFISPKIPGD